MTYPYTDCCPNEPEGEHARCDDGWCCVHETVHGEVGWREMDEEG